MNIIPPPTTPGDWRVSDRGNIINNSWRVAVVEMPPGQSETERQANAQLLAASKQMGVLLAEIIERLSLLPDTSPVRRDFVHRASEALTDAGYKIES